ncbi:hypothetical protein SAMN04488503_0892 [Humidesulfovibrio mexicanus]|uniref:DUF2059 domain-containing protein n=1 Tax=Humidesulfovibrio mexicanus TaxID=147047 RepID=A0A238YFJ6_9BACT|nr:DUF2059 domain-containing protein [Humidesulfovibrio mexicanus]SNR69129.1 hypothetical protein SAMN04488503_0892 [Humidesulfovibrio mexicanus]
MDAMEELRAKWAKRQVGAERRALVADLFHVLRDDAALLGLVNAWDARMWGLRPDIAPQRRDEARQLLVRALSRSMSAPGGLADQLESRVAHLFTEDEVRELTAFLSTPLGQKSRVLLGSLESILDLGLERMLATAMTELDLSGSGTG